MKIRALFILIFLSSNAYAVQGDYIKDFKPNFVCKIIVHYETKFRKHFIRKRNYLCSGSLINDSTILTAAHCDPTAIFEGKIKGKSNIQIHCPNQKPIKVVKKARKSGDDLMSLKLESPIELTNYPIFPKNKSEEFIITQNGACSSWGYGPNNKGNSGELNGVPAEIKTFKKFRHPKKRLKQSRMVSREKFFVFNSMNVVGKNYSDIGFFSQRIYLNESQKSHLMPGDSGGPLLCKYQGKNYLLGVSATGGIGADFDTVQSLIKSINWLNQNQFSLNSPLSDCNSNS